MTETVSKGFKNIKAGKLSRDNVTSVRATMIRVYFCSTGTDSITERDILMEQVYPRLRSYCRDKYGLQFQIVDLNWGLSPSSMDNQSNLTHLRMREIQECQSLSAGPSFIAFIGQKYGHRCLPNAIPRDDYESIQLALRSHRGRETRNAALLDQCYFFDGNNIPHVYVLKNKENLVPTFCDSNEEVRLSAQVKWAELQGELRNVIQKGAGFACLDGTMDSITAEVYCLSELENQIFTVMNAECNQQKKCVLITRNIQDLKNYTQDPKTQTFAEVRFDSKKDLYEMDTDSANMLMKMINRVKRFVSEDNIIHHDVLWRYEDVIHPKLHEEYLNSLCEKLYSVCIRLIDQGVSENDLPRASEDAEQHWYRCAYLASQPFSQESTLSALKEYVTGSLITPLVVYGTSGCDKSKMISNLAFKVKEIRSGDYIVVIRYIGLTAQSTDLRQMLISLCTEVTMAIGSESPIHSWSNMKELIECLSEMLITLSPSSCLVIILDGIDQLLPDQTTFTLSWIPIVLPPNIKLITTVHQTDTDVLHRLRNELQMSSPESFLEILPITAAECQYLFAESLARLNRDLTPIQREVFVSAINREPLELYVDLLVNIAKDVTSCTDIEKLHLPNNCYDGIINLFEKLEAKHGQLLVSRAFSYMVASSTGLSDCEMEDLLSLDEDVLNEAFPDFHPPMRRIPYVKWLELKQDVELFLTRRDVSGVSVTAWQHDMFDDVVSRRYITNSVLSTRLHSNMADYFLGKWSHRSKPAALSNNKQSDFCFSTDRKVPTQPHTFERHDGKHVTFNSRMYEQVPRHLDLAGRYEELESIVFFNYEWIRNKIKAFSLSHVLADLALHPSEESNLVKEVLRVAERVIKQDTNNLPTEISGHLLPYYNTHHNIRSLINQCDNLGLKDCALVANFPYQYVPGGSLQFTLKCSSDMHQFMFLHEDRYLVCKQKDESYVHTFDLNTGDRTATVLASIGELYITPNGKYFIIVDHITGKAIKIHEAETGAFMKQIIIMNHIEGKSNLYKKGPMCITNDRLCTVVTMNDSVLCICDIPSGDVLSIIPLDGKSCLCSITPDGRQVFCNSNNFLLAFDVYTLVHLFTIPVGNKPSQITFSNDGLRAFLSNDTEAIVTVMHLNEDVIDMSYRLVFDEKMPGDVIVDLTVSPDDLMFLIRGNTTLLVQHRGLERVIAIFNKPQDGPSDFKLPICEQSHFSHAKFTRDSQFVVATMFRNVYVWQISSGSLVSAMKGHMGLITSMLVSRSRDQVITRMEKSKDIQVWNVSDGVQRVSAPARLTDAVTEFQLTSDNSIAFVKCLKCHDIGVIDMRNGNLLQLLTYDAVVQDFAVSPDGNWVLVSGSPRLHGTAFKLWNLNEGRVVLETGDVDGYCVGMHFLPAIIMVSQKDRSLRAPYSVSIIQFTNVEFHEHVTTETSVENIKQKPFVTYSDLYLIISSALNSDVGGGYSQPCLHIFQIDNEMRMSTWDARNMNFQEHLSDILEVRPCRQQNDNIIAAVFSCIDHRQETSEKTNFDSNIDTNKTSNIYGFFLLDVSTGSLTLLCIPFPKPSYRFGTYPLIISPDCSLCLDETSNIFHIPSGEFVGQVSSTLIQPKAFALQNSVVLYYKDTMLYLVRASNSAVIASCDVSAQICQLLVCSDERTVLVGSQDGTVLCYTIIDPDTENATLILSRIPSRSDRHPEMFEDQLARQWDRNQNTSLSSSLSTSASLSEDKILPQTNQEITAQETKVCSSAGS